MINYDKKIVVTASVFAALGIVLGAFGAHGLKDLLSEVQLSSFETGVRYQMYHSLALLTIGLSTAVPDKTRNWVFRFFFFGIIFFSGSLYLISIKDVLHINVSFVGPVTPLGGLLFIIGWIRLIYGMLTVKKG